MCSTSDIFRIQRGSTVFWYGSIRERLPLSRDGSQFIASEWFLHDRDRSLPSFTWFPHKKCASKFSKTKRTKRPFSPRSTLCKHSHREYLCGRGLMNGSRAHLNNRPSQISLIPFHQTSTPLNYKKWPLFRRKKNVMSMVWLGLCALLACVLEWVIWIFMIMNNNKQLDKQSH